MAGPQTADCVGGMIQQSMHTHADAQIFWSWHGTRVDGEFDEDAEILADHRKYCASADRTGYIVLQRRALQRGALQLLHIYGRGASANGDWR